MKTIQKTIALSAVLLISATGFSQIGLGVQSTTNAALGASANTSIINQTQNSANVATKKTANVASTTSANTQKKAASTSVNARNRTEATVDATSGRVQQTATTAKQEASSVNASGNVRAESNGSASADKS